MENLCKYIYQNVFCNIKKSTVTVFLCGACSTKDKRSYRDTIRNSLCNENRLSILYPEDLFIELLHKKKYDLLTLERFLANDSDFIVIVCESSGSFTELGAFVNNDNTFGKVVVLLQSKYKNAKSFVRLGPVEYIKSKKNENVIFYNTDVKKTIDALRNILLERNLVRSNRFKDLNTITGQYNFIQLLLFFFDSLSYGVLNDWIGNIYYSLDFPKENFELFNKAAVRRLFHEGLIYKDQGENNAYKLTSKGYESVKNLLKYADLKDKTKIYNKIRMSVMYKGAYK